jgi:membrane peptidoglycan carboxypeptidase
MYSSALLVGSANPNYTPLDQISPYLRKSVLTTEDPSSSHIVVLSLKLSNNPLKNIRTKKFARGASTISMQLVKNAFESGENRIAQTRGAAHEKRTKTPTTFLSR